MALKMKIIISSNRLTDFFSFLRKHGVDMWFVIGCRDQFLFNWPTIRSCCSEFCWRWPAAWPSSTQPNTSSIQSIHLSAGSLMIKIWYPLAATMATVANFLLICPSTRSPNAPSSRWIQCRNSSSFWSVSIRPQTTISTASLIWPEI